MLAALLYYFVAFVMHICTRFPEVLAIWQCVRDHTLTNYASSCVVIKPVYAISHGVFKSAKQKPLLASIKQKKDNLLFQSFSFLFSVF